MKENDSTAIYDSKSAETDIAPVFELNGGNETGDPKILDDFSMNHENGTIDSPGKEDQDRLSHSLNTWENETVSSSRNENESVDPHIPLGGSTNPFLDDYDMYTDKIVLECDLPVLEVCYKEDSLVKDICVDMGVPQKETVVVDHELTNPFLLGPEEHKNPCDPTIGGGKNTEFLVSDENNNSAAANECERKEVHCDLKDLVEIREEEKSDATYKTIVDSSETDLSVVDKEFTTQRSLGSLLLHDQISGEQQVSESSKPSLNETVCPQEDVEVNSNTLHNRKVETESIAFNFNSPSLDQANTPDELTENINRDSTDKENDKKDSNEDNNISDEGKVQDNANEHDQPLITNDAKSDNLSEANHVQSSETQEKHDTDERSPESSRKSTSDDLPQENQVQRVSAKSRSQLQHDEGEISFSAASLVGFSGPIPYSGSISHRSDGSTTSGKSFAFPVLQSEWNSSPVRMAKADRAHFRKHKGWRSGLLCCRF